MLKKFFFTCLLLLFYSHHTAAQNKINFQAIILDNDSPRVTSSVEIILSVSKGTSTNRAVLYQETHQSITNASGIVSLTLGTGSPISGNWEQINWANNDLFLESYLKNGSNNQLLSESAIHAVPKALHAEIANTVMNNGINSLKIEDEAITNSKLATGSVDSRVLANGSVTAEKLAAGIGSQSNLSAGEGLAILNNEIQIDLTENYHQFHGFYLEHPTRINYSSFDTDVASSLLNNINLSDLSSSELKTLAANYLEGLNNEFPLIIGQVGDPENPKGIVFSTTMSTSSINAESISSSELKANDLITDTIRTNSDKPIMGITSLNEIETVTLSADAIEGHDGSFDYLNAENLTVDEDLSANTIDATTISLNEITIANDIEGTVVLSANEVQADRFIGDGSQLTGIASVSSLNDFDNTLQDSISLNFLLDTSTNLDSSNFLNSTENLGFGNQLYPSITTGSSNISIGNENLGSLEDGTYNISIGQSNLSLLTSGFLNIAIGDDALDNITGEAINSISTGLRNIGIGSQAGRGITTGRSNIAIGSSTLTSSSRPHSGSYNVAIGENAGSIGANAEEYEGSNSVFVGYASGPLGINAEGVAIGHFAKIGDDFTIAIGPNSRAKALESIAIGASARVDDGADYSIAIGSDVVVSDPNTMQLGSLDSSTGINTITNINADASFKTISPSSDKRLKRNIAAISDGMSIVSALNPVKYEKKGSLNATEYDTKEYGFVAQEVQDVLPDLIKDSGGDDHILTLNYNGLIAILTKALQEQQQQIVNMQQQLDLLTERIK